MNYIRTAIICACAAIISSSASYARSLTPEAAPSNAIDITGFKNLPALEMKDYRQFLELDIDLKVNDGDIINNEYKGVYSDDAFQLTIYAKSVQLDEPLHTCVVAYNENIPVAWTDPIDLNLNSADEQKLVIYPQFTHFDLDKLYSNTCQIALADTETYRPYSNYCSTRIKMGKCPMPVKITGHDFVGDPDNVNPDNFSFKIKVTNLSGFTHIEDYMTFVIVTNNESYLMPDFGKNLEALYPWTVDYVQINTPLPRKSDSGYYQFIFAKTTGNYIEEVYYSFYLELKFSGIEDVTVDGGEAEYYNLQGVRVDNPSHGYYIKRSGNSTSKVYIP